MGIFDEIYKNNEWQVGSGLGSLPSVTKGYRNFLEEFIKDRKIKSIVDFGCGDWQFSRLVDWANAKYSGYDVVGSLIRQNNKLYSTEKTKFFLSPKDWGKLPEADLLIVKDVLQHMSNKEVDRFFKLLSKKYKFMLVTNGTNPSNRLNEDIKLGGYRPLDVREAPFNINAKRIYHFKGPRKNIIKLDFNASWYKDVLLVTRDST